MAERISVIDGRIGVPNRPIVPFIEGDGIGPEVWRATRRVVDAAVERAYMGYAGHLMGCTEAADLINRGVEKAISHKTVTHDLAHVMKGARELGTTEFADAIVANLKPYEAEDQRRRHRDCCQSGTANTAVRQGGGIC